MAREESIDAQNGEMLQSTDEGRKKDSIDEWTHSHRTSIQNIYAELHNDLDCPEAYGTHETNYDIHHDTSLVPNVVKFDDVEIR